MPNEATTPVRDQRLRRGLTQQELADLCTAEGAPITYSQISRIESGEAMPRPRVRAVLARLLGLDIDLQNVEVSS